MIADQGKEFTSWTFEELCARHGILLWHCAVQAPSQNGVCERGGGVKALAPAVIRAHSVLGSEEVDKAVQEAVMAYNSDVSGDSGVSPTPL